MASLLTSAGRSCCLHGRHRVVRVMVKPQPRRVGCAGWFQRLFSPDPAPPPKFRLDVLMSAFGVTVTIVATVLMVFADLKTDLKADIKVLSDKLDGVEDKYNQVSEKNAKQTGLVDQLQENVNIGTSLGALGRVVAMGCAGWSAGGVTAAK